MKKRTLFLILLVSLALVFTACSGKSNTTDPDKEKATDENPVENETVDVEPVDKTKVFVTPQWVNSVIEGKQPQSDNYVILEVSWGEPSDEYKNAHIPGAVHMNTDLIEESTYWNIRTPEEIEQVFKDFGITKDTTVIIYSSDISAASRAAFVCIWAGVEEVHVLDGGLNAWLAGKFPTESGIVEPKPVKDFGGEIPAHPEYLLSMPEEVI
ncbi:MAG: sulfurtransferase, partial [Tissierellales bacterium]